MEDSFPIQQKEGLSMMHGYDMGGFFGFGLFGFLILIIIVLILIWMFRGNNGSARDEGRRSERRSLEILDERLAKGEISEEEYERLKKRIGH